MSARALRRHHRARMVARARRMYWACTEEELAHYCPRRADNMAWCNCVACGGPRRNHGLNISSWSWGKARTRQEILADLALREWADER